LWFNIKIIFMWSRIAINIVVCGFLFRLPKQCDGYIVHTIMWVRCPGIVRSICVLNHLFGRRWGDPGDDVTDQARASPCLGGGGGGRAPGTANRRDAVTERPTTIWPRYHRNRPVCRGCCTRPGWRVRLLLDYCDHIRMHGTLVSRRHGCDARLCLTGLIGSVGWVARGVFPNKTIFRHFRL